MAAFLRLALLLAPIVPPVSASDPGSRTGELLRDRTIAVGKAVRSYDLYVPPGIRERETVPLVLSLHGHGGSKERSSGARRGRSPHRAFRTVADREKLLVAYPQGEPGGDGKRGWNDCRAGAVSSPGTDDVAFLSALIDELVAGHRADPRRVYVAGTSNGGAMASRLAIERPEKLAAAASLIFSAPAASKCPRPRARVPFFLLTGTEDPLVPRAGGRVGTGRVRRGRVLSTEDTVRLWLSVHGLETAEPRVVRFPDLDPDDGSRVEARFYGGEGEDARVAHYEVVGGGHAEPSRAERLPRLYLRFVGPQNGDVETAEEVWKFFRGKRR